MGTSFNIRAYADENETKVTLLEGKIAAQINDKEYTLTPGKQLKCDKTFGGTSVRTVDPAEIVSWTRGYYIFKKARLQEVANTLKNWYGVNIMLSSGASDIIYTGVDQQRRETGGFPPASGRGIQRKMATATVSS